MRVKEHLVPLPTTSKDPDEYKISFGGFRFVSTKEGCAGVAGAIERAAATLSGESAVEAFQREQYEETWLPMLRRRTVPRYVPEWAREMYDAGEASDAAA